MPAVFPYWKNGRPALPAPTTMPAFIGKRLSESLFMFPT